MLTTNDKTIKLWKLSERDKQIDENGFNLSRSTFNSDNEYFHDLSELRIPKLLNLEPPVVQPSLRRLFANAHTFHINSVSVNSDQETFISADELRINLWNLEVTDESFGTNSNCVFTSFFFSSQFLFCSDCRYQTIEHGGTDRGDQCGRIPPTTLQHSGLFHQQGSDQTVRHARGGPLWSIFQK